ncbi:SDR family NAD(P)-dependent oxidoreductase [Roseibium aggregatum]|uniref:SDR family NAD(P)-dependent oxidoreductase n=1 Tax=Roseibium aggregatum TaxID=187304 RepID=UPI0025AC1445|nr:SDR family NAD(P)-dependent oxidoreductase [Roseibium aggregatum]WJS05686.1 SDR family NAD(P)-dependent oxidoreductase [Roseibium aggregatum]
MKKTILITGATDGIGLLTARGLALAGHLVLLHGRNADKLKAARQSVAGNTETYLAEMSIIADVNRMADEILGRHERIDVIINNAGVYKTSSPLTGEGLDTRFVVNTIAPYVLTQRLMPVLASDSRVVNLSSAAQAPVDLSALRGERRIADMDAYAQSKLGLTIWTRELARRQPGGPVFVAVNPGSLLATKMVRDGFGTEGNDLSIGADILTRAALSDEFADATGKYFDNDSGHFANPERSALDASRSKDVMGVIEEVAASAA